MSDIALKSLEPLEGNRRLAGAAIAIFVIAGAFALAALVPGGTSYPDAAVMPFADWIGALFLWFKNTFTWLTRGLTAVIDVPLDKGHVVVFSNNPIWRGETEGSYFLVFNALLNYDHLDAGRKLDPK